MVHEIDYLASARRTLDIEAKAIRDWSSTLDESFVDACNLLLGCKGRVIVTGMGKSGHIANKIAATFASTGTPAFFVHPAEAGHGDLGMITPEDVVIAISYSGSSAEILTLVPVLKRMQTPIIGISGNPASALADQSDVHLCIKVEHEACPLNLAPTSSTTLTLVLGDCLAIALLEKRGFTADDFAFSHPLGALGRKLLLRVSDIMHGETDLPLCQSNQSLKQVLMVMTGKGLGLAVVVDEAQHLLGVFTDGDLRRVLEMEGSQLDTPIASLMNTSAKTINAEMLAAQALGQMEKSKITSLVVTREDRVEGVIHMHDLLKAGVV